MLTKREQGIFDYVKENGRKVIPCSRETAKALGVDQSLISAYYVRLQKKGYLKKENTGKTSRFIVVDSKKCFVTLPR